MDRTVIIFSEKLKYYMDKCNLKQVDIANTTGVSQQSVSNWLSGKQMPRMGIVETLAEYFNIKRSDLLEDKTQESGENYYTNPETAKLAQEIYDDPELKILFDAVRSVKPEQLKAVTDLVLTFKKEADGA